jgi:uncharacterized protein (DUF2236 family)
VSRIAVPVSRLVNREAVVVLGWGRAILLQIAHPLVAAGVSDFSGFHTARGGYLQRARHTIGAMLTLTFGTTAEADRVIDHINAIHQRVHGVLREPVGRFPAGTPYDATDPALLAWVHVTLLDSILQAYELFVRPLTTEERDAFCAEAAPTIMRLGVPADRLPMTAAALAAQFDAMLASGDLAVGAQARGVASALLSPSIGAATPMFAIARDITVGLLPPEIRASYGYAWDAGRERQWRRRVRFVRGVRGLLPSLLCEWPAARAAA